MWGLRLFEFFVMALVLGVVICFCIQLSLIEHQSVAAVFRGYVPSSAIVQNKGLVLPAFVRPQPLTALVSTKVVAFSVQRLCLTPSSSGAAWSSPV